MSDSYRVDLNELENVTDRVAGFVGFLEQSLDGIQQRITAVQSSWTGPSATAANEAFTQWLAGAQEVSEGITTMRQSAVAARDRYNAAVAANLQMLGRSTGSRS